MIDIKQGLERLSACLDTISTNVHEVDGRAELRRIAEELRNTGIDGSFELLLNEVDMLFSHPDLESEKECMFASFDELFLTIATVGNFTEEIDQLENKLMDYKDEQRKD